MQRLYSSTHSECSIPIGHSIGPLFCDEDFIDLITQVILLFFGVGEKIDDMKQALMVGENTGIPALGMGKKENQDLIFSTGELNI